MFCSNCGSQIPDGSNFCSTCGARIAIAETPSQVSEELFNSRQYADQPEKKEESKVVDRQPAAVSFDWSGVKDEPHKKVVKEVTSPWGSDEVEAVDPREFLTETEKNMRDEKDQRSRTLSFIEILKKEREAKAKAAEEEARPVTEREQTEPDVSAFEQTPSFYVPSLYDDLDKTVQTPFSGMPEEPMSFDDFEELAADEVPELDLDELAKNDEANKPLDSELASILRAGSGQPEEVKINLFEEEPVKEAVQEEVAQEEPEVIKEVAEEPAEVKPVANTDLAEEYLALDEFSGIEPTEELRVPETMNIEEPEEEPVVFGRAARHEAEEAEEIIDIEEPAEESAEEFYLAQEQEEVAEEPESFNDELDGLELEPAFEEPKYEEPAYEKPSFEEPAFKEPEYAAPDFGFNSEEQTIDELYDNDFDAITIDTENEAVEQIDDDEFNLEDLVAELSMSNTQGMRIPDPIIPEIEPEPVIPEVQPEPVVPEVQPEPVAEEKEDEKDIEIEALKKRLAELMGDNQEEDDDEDIVLDTEDDGLASFNKMVDELDDDEEDELPLIDPTPEEPELEDLEPVVPVYKEEPAEEPKTDAMSVEDLEKDLFGEVSEEEIEAEATKKIDKFYTLYKKNEEFQRLLDEEYNKLKAEEEVPTVESVMAQQPQITPDAVASEYVEEPKEEQQPQAEPVPAAPVQSEAPATVAPEQEPQAVATPAAPAQVAAAPVVAAEPEQTLAEDEEDLGKGGGALTVIAVVIAALLVILLAIILVLNFAPDSGIAMKIDSIIETITSYFSVTGFDGKFLL